MINAIIRELFYVFACSSHLRGTQIINVDDEIVDVICNVIEYGMMYDDEQAKGKLVGQNKGKENELLRVLKQVDPRAGVTPLGTLACDLT